jgi:hypothetical protein
MIYGEKCLVAVVVNAYLDSAVVEEIYGRGSTDASFWYGKALSVIRMPLKSYM